MTWQEIYAEFQRRRTIQYLRRHGVASSLSSLPDESLQRLKQFSQELEALR